MCDYFSQRKETAKVIAGKCLLRKGGKVLTIFCFGILVHASSNVSGKKIKIQIQLLLWRLVQFRSWMFLKGWHLLRLFWLFFNTICVDRWEREHCCRLCTRMLRFRPHHLSVKAMVKGMVAPFCRVTMTKAWNMCLQCSLAPLASKKL